MNMKQLEVLADFADIVGEGPVWDEDSGTLYWTDIVGKKFCRLDWNSRKSEILHEGIEISGFALNRAGGYIVANTQGIWRWDGKGQLDLIVAEVDGKFCRMNDAAADPKGRFLAGSNFYEGSGNYPLGCLICIDTDGRARILDEGIHLANGIGFSPDETQLYFTDSAARRIYRYDYDTRAGTARNRTVLVQVGAHEGVPDGMTVDAEGFLWSAQWYGSCVVRYDPDGKEERRIPTPAKQTSSVAFGGPDLTDLFITSAGQSFASPMMPPGYDPHNGSFGGQLFRLEAGIRGKLEFKADIPGPGQASKAPNPALPEG